MKQTKTPQQLSTLVCLPFAGGSSVVYHAWRHAIPGAVVIPVELPGRGERIREPFAPSLLELVDVLHGQISESAAERHLVLFGYSYGAIVAFELARRLHQAGRREVSLVVAASRAPQLMRNRVRLAELPDALLLRDCQELYGAIDPALLSDPSFARYLISVLRADLRNLECYQYRDAPPLDIPIVAYGGRADHSIELPELLAWKEQTTASFVAKMFDGGHLFIRTQGAELLEHLRSVLIDRGLAHAVEPAYCRPEPVAS